MAHYVISDLHGNRERFHKMLETIGFTESDTLYILGDIVDRGPEPIELLLEVMETPNMIMLLGNHEHMCMQVYSIRATELDHRRWNRNNNRPTKAGIARLSFWQKIRLFHWLHHLPVHLETELEGRKFYLVHGFPGQTLHDEVWGRPAPDAPNPVPGSTVIVGHTPVCCLGRDDDQEIAYCTELALRGEHMTIYHGAGFIDIDCGCGYDIPPSALACLRLEDMEEFYVCD